MGRAPSNLTAPLHTLQQPLGGTLWRMYLDQGSTLCVTWITYVLELATPDTLMNHVYF